MNVGRFLLFYVLVWTALIFPPAWIAVLAVGLTFVKARRDRRRYYYR